MTMATITANLPDNQNNDALIAYQFLDYNKNETIKENILMVDEIFQNIKDIRSLHSQKKTLNQTKRFLLHRSLQKRHANRGTREDADDICKPVTDNRREWQDRRDLLKMAVPLIGDYIKAQEEYLQNAVKNITDYVGDITKELLSTKMEYSLNLACKQVQYQPPVTCLTSKKKHEKLRMRNEEAEKILHKCEQLKEALKALEPVSRKTKFKKRFESRRDAMKYFLSTRKSDSDLDFDISTRGEFIVEELRNDLNSQYW